MTGAEASIIAGHYLFWQVPRDQGVELIYGGPGTFLSVSAITRAVLSKRRPLLVKINRKPRLSPSEIPVKPFYKEPANCVQVNGGGNGADVLAKEPLLKRVASPSPGS